MNSPKGKNSMIIYCILAFAFSTYSLMVSNWAAASNDFPACMDCHDDKQSAQYVHSPAAGGNCETCHEPTREHLEKGGPDGMKTNRAASACYQCHEKKNDGTNVHPALMMEGECVLCHNPHGSDFEKFLVMQKNSLCFECHNRVPEGVDKGSAHSVVKDEKSCLNCHNPHSTYRDSLLINTQKTLCLKCHDREIAIKEGEKTRMVKNIKQKVEGIEFVHMPAVWCTNCHAFHGSVYRSLLIAPFSEKIYNKYVPGDKKTKNTYELCFMCHDPGMLNETITERGTRFRNDTVLDGVVVRENLHLLHVVNAKNKTKGRSCSICHDPHGSANPHVIKNTWTMKKHNLAIKFENKLNGGKCSGSCHALKRRYQRID